MRENKNESHSSENLLHHVYNELGKDTNFI